jgi:head-tail adaptor
VAIGDYRTRYVLMRRTATQEAGYGSKPRTYPDAGEAWGTRPEETAANVRHTSHQAVSRAEVVIRLRGRVSVGALDQIRVKATGDIYTLEGVRFEAGAGCGSAGETVCEGFRETGS